MDFDGEPSHFQEHDVDASIPACMSHCRSASFPRWHDLMICSRQRFEVYTYSLLTGSEDDFTFNAAQTCEARTQLGSDATECQLQRRKHGVKSVRCQTWSFMPTRGRTVLQAESFAAQQQPSDATVNSCMATFSAGEELAAETQNGVSHTWTSAPTQGPTPESDRRNRQSRLVNLHDLVPAPSDHGIILSAMKTIDQLLGGRRDPEVDKNGGGREQFGADPINHVQTAPSQHRDQSERSQTFLGLPGRVTVSMREINMMTPLSF